MSKSAIIVIALIAVLVCSGISLSAGIGLGFVLRDSVEAPGVNALSTDPVVNSTNGPPAQAGDLLFSDDFSTERWDVYEDVDVRKNYDDGRYVIYAITENYDYWEVFDNRFDDFALEVEATQLSGPDLNSYGLIFRHQEDGGSFYRFEIGGDGTYAFSKMVDEEYIEITEWTDSVAIVKGHGQNRLRVEAKGPVFIFYINGEQVATATDSDFAAGEVGVIVGTFEEGDVAVAFDNLKVYALE